VESLGLGSYIVNAAGFCGDCHTSGPTAPFLSGGSPAPLENGGRDYLVNLRIQEAVYRSSDAGVRVAIEDAR